MSEIQITRHLRNNTNEGSRIYTQMSLDLDHLRPEQQTQKTNARPHPNLIALSSRGAMSPPGTGQRLPNIKLNSSLQP
jgi:hypothetical protein